MKNVNVLQLEHGGIPYDPFIIADGREDLLLAMLTAMLHKDCGFRLPQEDESADDYYTAFSELWIGWDDGEIEDEEARAQMSNGRLPNMDTQVRWWVRQINDITYG